jgi:hypothetical protein
MRRGDNIPSVAEYAHWNEEAEAMWYAENRYDMEHADEEIEDDWDAERDYEEPEPDIDASFYTEGEARECYDRLAPTAHSINLTHVHWTTPERWEVEGWTKKLYESWTKRRHRRH